MGVGRAKKKGIEVQRGKPRTPTRAIDAIIRKNGQKKRRVQSKEKEARLKLSYTGSFGWHQPAGIIRKAYFYPTPHERS